MESSLSDGRIISGQLFTAFDEETKGTRVLAEGMDGHGMIRDCKVLCSSSGKEWN